MVSVMKIIKQEIQFEESLKQRLEFICEFSKVNHFAKYKLVMFAMAKLMEMETTEQNKVALYLLNHIKI